MGGRGFREGGEEILGRDKGGREGERENEVAYQ